VLPAKGSIRSHIFSENFLKNKGVLSKNLFMIE